jgi:hypothetical protein
LKVDFLNLCPHLLLPPTSLTYFFLFRLHGLTMACSLPSYVTCSDCTMYTSMSRKLLFCEKINRSKSFQFSRASVALGNMIWSQYGDGTNNPTGCGQLDMYSDSCKQLGTGRSMWTLLDGKIIFEVCSLGQLYYTTDMYMTAQTDRLGCIMCVAAGRRWRLVNLMVGQPASFLSNSLHYPFFLKWFASLRLSMSYYILPAEPRK